MARPGEPSTSLRRLLAEQRDTRFGIWTWRSILVPIGPPPDKWEIASTIAIASGLVACALLPLVGLLLL